MSPILSFEWPFILSLITFAATMTGTPGPNNLMVTASGANFGYRCTVPHMLGIGCGLVSMILLVAAGLGVVFVQFPVLHDALRWLGSGYLLYLAWKIGFSSSSLADTEHEAKPMSFMAAASFQYVNPKAWMMSVTAISTFSFTGELYWYSVSAIAAIFFLVCYPSVSLWAGFGIFIRRWLAQEKTRRIFNGLMGVLTAGCVVMIWQ
ncbi:LysE family translocator [Photobacterium swingsii]|uniref:LysE family translocator n=1 Tax=Photobacterium swingsii TaxID=680026 RepID=A0A0J8VBY5_9GAMM|nr:LysE family translocator [Photobacterium swingsii]KMV30587.1 lysine exporter protein LysE/YggA [Photobacterium swingsii]PSW23861.1 LysE family translocator [Photobacterium swingsii]